MKRTSTAEIARPAGGLAELHDTEFYIVRNSTSKPETMLNHHYHNCYELYYLYDGDRYYFIKDKTYHIKRGTFVLIKPYEIHSTINYAKSGYDRFLVMLKHSFVAEQEALLPGINLFECFDKDIRLVSLGIQEQSFVEGLLFLIAGEYRNKAPMYEAILKTAVTQLLLIIARHTSDAADMIASGLQPTHKTVLEVEAYINHSYHERITLASISEKFFISPTYLSRIFNQVTGIPFKEYLNGVRIKEAQQLLATTDRSIADIAEIVGYKSSTQFGRRFGAIMGMSPGEYRRFKRRPKG